MKTRKERSFRPTLGDDRLEDRLVLSRVVAAQVTAAVPVVTVRAVNQSILQMHDAYLQFLRSTTQTYNALARQVARGTISDTDALTTLQNATLNNATTLFNRLDRAASRLPFGHTQLSPLLADQVNSLLDQLFSFTTFQDAGSPAAVQSIFSSYSAVKQTTISYIQDGVASGLFILK